MAGLLSQLSTLPGSKPVPMPQSTPATIPGQLQPKKPIFQSNGSFNGTTQSVPMGVKAANPIVDNSTKPNNAITPAYQSSSTPTMYNANANYNAGVTAPAAQQGTPIPNSGSNTSVPQLSNAGVSTAPANSPSSAPGILNSLLGASNANANIGQNAANIASNYGQQIADVNKAFGNAAVGDQSTGSVAVGGGNANLEYNAMTARTNALAQAEQAALQGTGQQLTGQSQQQSGLLGALGQATNLQQIPYGTPTYNAATGQWVNSAGGNLDPQTVASSLAQKVASGQMTYDQAVSSLGYAGSAGQQFLNNAIQQVSPGFNIPAATGSAAATQANAQVGGSAGVNAAQQAFNSSYQDYSNLQNTVQNISSFSSLLTQTMVSGGINPSDVKYANQSLAAIRNQLSSGQQATYDNTLAGLRSRVSGLLAAGGAEIPTQITADATKILDGSLPLSSLQDVLGRIDQEGQALLSNKASQVNQNYGMLQQGQGSSQNTNAQSGNTASNSLYSF